jgi:hypothetical protein
MLFVLDESAEARIGTFLEAHGHEGEIVRRDFPAGLSDEDEKIAALQRLLVTHGEQLDQFLVVTPRGVRVRCSR